MAGNMSKKEQRTSWNAVCNNFYLSTRGAATLVSNVKTWANYYYYLTFSFYL